MTVTALDRIDPTPLDLVELDPANAHRHTRRCWWDHLECRWQCPPPVPQPQSA